MTGKGVPVRPWVPLGEAPLFDQTNGTTVLGAARGDASGRSDLERLISAGIITLLATGTTMGGW